MITINDVKCDFCLYKNYYDDFVITDTRDLKGEWNLLGEEERKRYFTTRIEKLKVYAEDIIEYFVDDLECSGEAYEDFSDYVDVSGEHKAELQAVLDKITSDSAFEVYYTNEQIDPTIDYKEYDKSTCNECGVEIKGESKK